MCVVGSINADLVVRVDRLPRPGETRLAVDAVTLPGGKGGNQAVAAARVGAPTTFVGAVGTDAHADLLVASLADEAVDTRHLRHAHGPSGLAVIEVDASGENTILVVAGANVTVSAGVVTSSVAAGAYEGCGVVLAQLEIDVDAVQTAFAHARAAGLRTILNAAPGRVLPEDLVSVTDVLVVNETELLIAAAMAPEADDVTRSAALAALAREVPIVVLTLGADGARVVDEAGELRLPAVPVEPVDTVGAGDAFCGVLAASLAAGAPITEAVRRANAAGALATTARGARSAPTATMLAELLSRRDAAPC